MPRRPDSNARNQQIDQPEDPPYQKRDPRKQSDRKQSLGKPDPLENITRVPETRKGKHSTPSKSRGRSRKTHLGESNLGAGKALGPKDTIGIESFVGIDELDIGGADSDEEDQRPKEREETTKETTATRRNRDRVDQANVTDQRLTSKYLPKIDEFLPNTIPGPDDAFIPPPWLMEAIEEVAKAKAPIPEAPPVKFDLSEEAVRFNTELLKDNELSLERLLLEQQHTTLGFGSEFRPLDQLEKTLGQHPNFKFFSEVLADGMDYRFTKELSEDERKAEVSAILERGNHKSVQEDEEEVAKLLEKQRCAPWILPARLPGNCPRYCRCNGSTRWGRKAILLTGRWYQVTEAPSNSRPLLPPYVLRGLCEPPNRHGSLCRNDLRVVPLESNPLHRRPQTGVSETTHPHRKI